MPKQQRAPVSKKMSDLLRTVERLYVTAGTLSSTVRMEPPSPSGDSRSTNEYRDRFSDLLKAFEQFK